MTDTIKVLFLGEPLTLSAHTDACCAPETTYHTMLLGSMFDLWPAWRKEPVTARWLGHQGVGATTEEAIADLEQKLIPLARVLAPMVEACESKCEDFDPFGAWDQIPAHIRDDLATERGLAPAASEIEKRDTDPSELEPDHMGG